MIPKTRKDYVRHLLTYFDNWYEDIPSQLWTYSGGQSYSGKIIPKLNNMFDYSRDVLDKSPIKIRTPVTDSLVNEYNNIPLKDIIWNNYNEDHFVNPFLVSLDKIPIYKYTLNQNNQWTPIEPPDPLHFNPQNEYRGELLGEVGVKIVESLEPDPEPGEDDERNADYKAILYVKRLRDVYDRTKISNIITFNNVSLSVDDLFDFFGNYLVPVKRNNDGDMIPFEPNDDNYLGNLNCLNPITLESLSGREGQYFVRRIYNNLDFSCISSCYPSSYNDTQLIQNIRDNYDETTVDHNNYAAFIGLSNGYATLSMRSFITNQFARYIELSQRCFLTNSILDTNNNLVLPNFLRVRDYPEGYEPDSFDMFLPERFNNYNFYSLKKDYYDAAHHQLSPFNQEISRKGRNGIEIFSMYYEDIDVLDRCFEFDYDGHHYGIVAYNQDELENYLTVWEVPFEYRFDITPSMNSRKVRHILLGVPSYTTSTKVRHILTGVPSYTTSTKVRHVF